MKKIYCVICCKYRRFKNPKILYIFEKILALSIICSKYKNENEKIFKEEEPIDSWFNLKNITVLKVWLKKI